MQSAIDQYLDGIKQEYESAQAQIRYLRHQNETFNAQEEVRKANERADRIQRMSLHVLSDDEMASAKLFRDKHYGLCQRGRMSTTFEYVLTGTGIGTAIEIRCPVCGQAENITDYSNW